MCCESSLFIASTWQEGKGHDGNKPSRVVFCGKTNKLFTSGFSRMSERQYALWDPVCVCVCVRAVSHFAPVVCVQSNLDKALTMENIDTASGVLFPFWDDGTNMVYLVGKVGDDQSVFPTSSCVHVPTQGDTQIRFFEVTDDSPYVFFLSMYQSTIPGRSVCSLAKRHMDYMKCEVMRFFKLQHTKGLVEPLSMTVPRKVCVTAPHTSTAITLVLCAVRDVSGGHFPTVSLWGAGTHRRRMDGWHGQGPSADEVQQWWRREWTCEGQLPHTQDLFVCVYTEWFS